MLSFDLSKQMRLVLDVHGPGPGCELVGRIPIAGHKGLNLFPFDGTVRNRPLPPGTYRLTIRAKDGKRDLARTYVTIVAPGFPVKVRLRPECRATTAPTTAFAFTGSLVGFPFTGVGFADALVTANGTSSGSGEAGADSQSSGGVLGGEQATESGGFAELPIRDLPDAATGDSALLLLGLVLASLLAIVLAVRRHHRRHQRV